MHRSWDTENSLVASNIYIHADLSPFIIAPKLAYGAWKARREARHHQQQKQYVSIRTIPVDIATTATDYSLQYSQRSLQQRMQCFKPAS